MLLELKEVSVHYGKIEALKGISMQFEKGTIGTLIGANGAGKTTTLRAIMGLIPLSSGEIWFQGKRLDQMTTQMIFGLGIALVPEGRRIFPFLSVMENLMMGAYLIKCKEEIKHNLEVVFRYFPILNIRSSQLGGSLSGGEQQMLAIGRSLMSSPKLLLMDEPTMGLSPIMAKEVANVGSAINRDGVSIVLVEQNARIALRLAKNGYVMETGRIALYGDAKDLVDNEHVKNAYLGG